MGTHATLAWQVLLVLLPGLVQRQLQGYGCTRRNQLGLVPRARSGALTSEPRHARWSAAHRLEPPRPHPPPPHSPTTTGPAHVEPRSGGSPDAWPRTRAAEAPDAGARSGGSVAPLPGEKGIAYSGKVYKRHEFQKHYGTDWAVHWNAAKKLYDRTTPLLRPPGPPSTSPAEDPAPARGPELPPALWAGNPSLCEAEAQALREERDVCVVWHILRYGRPGKGYLLEWFPDIDEVTGLPNGDGWWRGAATRAPLANQCHCFRVSAMTQEQWACGARLAGFTSTLHESSVAQRQTALMAYTGWHVRCEVRQAMDEPPSP